MEPADGWLERDGVSLHYVEWRDESSRGREPPVLLLHGLSSNARYWDRLARNLVGRRLIALDQRGHGLTGRPPKAPDLAGGYSMDAQRFMQPPLPRFSSFSKAIAESRRDFNGAWADDLEPFVHARVVPEGDSLVLTLTAAVRLELLRGLYDSQPDVLWPRL